MIISPWCVWGRIIREALTEINQKKMGATLVVDGNRKLVGIISDGDLRRALSRGDDIYRMKVEDIMSATPKTIDEDATSAGGHRIDGIERHYPSHHCGYPARN